MLGKLLNPGPKYRWKKVLVIVVLSCCCISGGTAASYLFYVYTKHLHETNETSVIQAVVQTAALYAPLQTSYLAEVLDLANDQPANFSQFDLNEAYERLMATHVIRDALIRKIKPNILYVDYEVRQPIAYLGDYTNTALDREGMLFPYMPFYPPRCMPQIYLGAKAPPNPWGQKLEERELVLITDILGHFEVGSVERIDLSQSESPSAGTRQIAVVLKNRQILRLTSKNYAQELKNYSILAIQMHIEKPCVIDFRNPEVAYINYYEK